MRLDVSGHNATSRLILIEKIFYYLWLKKSRLIVRKLRVRRKRRKRKRVAVLQ